jgi:uncharacterized membrane protein YhaH (DUF805 family)
MSGYLAVLKKYAVFQGRARRKEYWMFYLVNVLVVFGLVFLDMAAGTMKDESFGILTGLYVLLILIPSIAVGVRRLHDTARSGWWLLVGAVPLVGPIVLLVFNVQDSTPGTNEYGPSPKGARA